MWGAYNESLCGTGVSTLGHTYTNRTFDQGLGQVELIRLTFGPAATSHLPGSVEPWPLAQRGGSDSLGSLTEISRGLPSNKILGEVSTLKAVTCPLQLPSGYLMLSWIRLWIFIVAFFLSWRSLKRGGGGVPPAVLLHRLKEVPYALKCHSSMEESFWQTCLLNKFCWFNYLGKAAGFTQATILFSYLNLSVSSSLVGSVWV